jgi:hypothetical protein
MRTSIAKTTSKAPPTVPSALSSQSSSSSSAGGRCSIVGSPEDAFRCLMGTEIDVLAVGNCYLRKDAQKPARKQNYETAFELN